MTEKRKHHAPKTTDAKLDAIRRALGVDMRRDKAATLQHQMRELHSEVKALRKIVEKSQTTTVSARQTSVDDIVRELRKRARDFTGEAKRKPAKRPSRIEREGWTTGDDRRLL